MGRQNRDLTPVVLVLDPSPFCLLPFTRCNCYTLPNMTPSLPIPTDNIYKFACLFGLALIVSSIFAFVSTYTNSLNTKVKYSEMIISLQGKGQKSPSEEELLGLYKKLIEVTTTNEGVANRATGAVLAFGISLSIFGATSWNKKIQQRDDKLATLQIEKLEVEIANLRSNFSKADPIDSAPPEINVPKTIEQ